MEYIFQIQNLRSLEVTTSTLTMVYDLPPYLFTTGSVRRIFMETW